MTSEENQFIKKLEVYFDETFNNYTRNRVLSYLEDYKKIVQAKNPIVIYKDKIREIEVIKEIPISPENIHSYKAFITKKDLMENAKDLCSIYEISIDEFMDSSGERIRNDVAKVRKKFCETIHSKYICTNIMLANFLKVHHSTITYYLIGKKIRKNYVKQKV
jgi:hypothetical protein